MRLAPVQPFAAEQYCSTTICSGGHRCLTLPCTPPPTGRRIATGSRNRSPPSPQSTPTGWTSSCPAGVFHRDTSDSGRRPLYMARRAKDKTPFVFAPKADTPRRRRRLAQWRVRYCTRWHKYIYMRKCTFYHIIWSNTLYTCKRVSATTVIM